MTGPIIRRFSTEPARRPIPWPQLNRKLQAGEVTLKRDGPSGYLRSVLDALQVPVDSQMMVFVKDSVQAGRINRDNPRAKISTVGSPSMPRNQPIPTRSKLPSVTPATSSPRYCGLPVSNGQMSTELGRCEDDRQSQHHRRDWVGVRCDGLVRLPSNERGKYDEERNKETTSEGLVGCGGQVEPLVFEHEDGGPTIQLPAAAATAAPFVFRAPVSIASRT